MTILGTAPTRLKFHAAVIAGQSPNNEDVRDQGALPFIQGCAEFGDWHPTATKFCDVAPKVAEAGDVLISVRAPVGELNIAEESLGIGRGVAAIRARGDFHSRFMYWLLSASNEELRSHATGTTFEAVSASDIGNLPFRLSPPPKQQRIANFLDDKTARIDALIAEKEILVERISELRQSYISESVTVNAASGWYQTKLKYLVKEIIDTEHKTVPFVDDGGFLVARTSNIKKGHLVFDDAKYTDQVGYAEWTRRAVPMPGDILFTREAPAGEACLVPPGIPLCLGQRTVLLQLKLDVVDPEFVLWSLYGGLAARFISDLSQGSTVAHFNMPDIGNIPLFTGPPGEQRDRAKRLVGKLRQFDDLVEHAVEHISRLREYRSSLISAAVTGQVDLGAFREAA